MEILIYPAKILRNKSKKVKNISDSQLKDLASELKRLMVEKDGLGLAAPQIGHSIRLIAINTKKGDQIFFNPKIYWRSFFRKESAEEGCLSLPDIFGTVKRHKIVWVSYFDLQGKKRKLKAAGLLARVFQHEIDHLNGKLFIDKMTKLTKGQDLLDKLLKNAK